MYGTTEATNEEAALNLEKALFEAANGRYWSDARSAIKGYAKKEIYPLYLKHCAQAYASGLPNPEIIKLYE